MNGRPPEVRPPEVRPPEARHGMADVTRTAADQALAPWITRSKKAR